DQEVQMRRAEVVPLLRAQQHAGGAVDRYRVSGRLHAAEAERPVDLGRELAAQGHLGLRGVLVLVETDRRRGPDIALGPPDPGASLVADPALEEERLARRGRAQ